MRNRNLIIAFAARGAFPGDNDSDGPGHRQALLAEPGYHGPATNATDRAGAPIESSDVKASSMIGLAVRDLIRVSG